MEEGRKLRNTNSVMRQGLQNSANYFEPLKETLSRRIRGTGEQQMRTENSAGRKAPEEKQVILVKHQATGGLRANRESLIDGNTLFPLATDREPYPLLDNLHQLQSRPCAALDQY